MSWYSDKAGQTKNNAYLWLTNLDNKYNGELVNFMFMNMLCVMPIVDLSEVSVQRSCVQKCYLFFLDIFGAFFGFIYRTVR